ncbi:isopenicillin N synthase family oxygenase [Sphingomonas sp. AP4-R1]|uniref:isopenicillin N synthase family dioxygenase n=1 Tax=Sphingomonas sp. AP4-R1 TaxID=2735134 RepID=UPI001493DB5D|nr:isopenicillin N synthase family oxygenase [Sphingomonas sp. AP4-R1]QJU56666.1 isopenicillin N synthase family oxygenase [Sphingomonas sp. AP4-R1]
MATTLETPTVPTVSLADEARDPIGFAQALGGSFERYGFAIVADHGVPPEVIAQADATAKAFFALPDDVKRQYANASGGGQRGYIPFGIETAKGAKAHDLKEFWHVGRELPAGDPLRDVMPDNVWPAEIEDFRRAQLALYDALEDAGRRLLTAIARYLNLPADFFDATIENGNSVLRLLHYPPMGPDGPSIRAGAHEDINTITLLLGAEEAGLELLDRDGNWLPVQPKPGELAINVGDMLQRLTNNVLRSTTHRVLNPAPERRGFARYSMPFFLHFRPDYLIETLPQCVGPDRPNLYAPITAHDYLYERLREIKLV